MTVSVRFPNVTADDRTLTYPDGSGGLIFEYVGVDSLMNLLASYLESPHPRSPHECEAIDKIRRELGRRHAPVVHERCPCGAELECGCWA